MGYGVYRADVFARKAAQAFVLVKFGLTPEIRVRLVRLGRELRRVRPFNQGDNRFF
jgi:hypothetical protein